MIRNLKSLGGVETISYAIAGVCLGTAIATVVMLGVLDDSHTPCVKSLYAGPLVTKVH